MELYGDIATLKEIEGFVDKKNRGEPLPMNWQILTENYIKFKTKFAVRQKERLDQIEEDLRQAKENWLLLAGVDYDSIERT